MMASCLGFVNLILLVLVGCSFIVAETASFKHDQAQIHQDVAKGRVGGEWSQTQKDLTMIDTSILPDYWETHVGEFLEVDPRIPTNGAEPPEQLVKVTDRKHKFPVFATICSIGFLATVITLLIICCTS